MSLSSDLLDRLDKVLVYRQGEMRAPHKPLYLLFCIASMQHGLPQLQSFEVVNQALAKALRRFGPRTQTVHPEYPFWRLQRDNLAKVTTQGELEFRKSNSDPTKSSLLKANACGGLKDEDYALLNSDAALQSLVVHKIFDSHFPPSIHDEIIRHFDLILCDPHARDESTEMGFRKSVVEAYNNRCALTSFSVSSGGVYVGIEATHICWPQMGGNDKVSNGIAMTTLHRKLFHLGLFKIGSEDYRVHVSQHVRDDSTALLSLTALDGAPLNLPMNEEHWPSKQALKWHARWVFRG
jgi:putative restriction endonuclease